MKHGQKALLTCDVWEHAYYIDFRNARPKYIETFLANLVELGLRRREPRVGAAPRWGGRGATPRPPARSRGARYAPLGISGSTSSASSDSDSCHPR